MRNNFIKVAAISPNVVLGDIEKNVFHIINSFNSIPQSGSIDVVVYPELCLTGYTLGDLFLNEGILDLNNKVKKGLEDLCEWSSKITQIIIIGAPLEYNNCLYNCAVVISGGKILGIVPKSCIPTYDEFYEGRWFNSGKNMKNHYILDNIPFGTDIIFRSKGYSFGIEICEDLWAPIPPSSKLALAGAEIIFNLSASNEIARKNDYLRSLISNQSARCICGYVYASAGFGESSTDLVYFPKEYIYENGECISSDQSRFDNPDDYKYEASFIDLNKIRLLRRKNTTFRDQAITEGYRYINFNSRDFPTMVIIRKYSKYPFRCPGFKLIEIFNIQVQSLRRRLRSTTGNVVIGVSGGSDSTLALLVAYEAVKSEGNGKVYGITMPCYGTTNRTKTNAMKLMDGLGDVVVPVKINISSAVTQHRKDIGLDRNDFSTTYENCQARERTQVLMDYANKVNAIVLGTGDMSELALGWCTYNADHMSMYNVNASIPKTLVLPLIEYMSNKYGNEVKMVINDILDTPVSPELLPNQLTENSVGPYVLHDFFLYHLMRSGWNYSILYQIACITFKGEFSAEEIRKWIDVFKSRFIGQQFKRNCMPDGPKVGTISLSPRGDWRMPSDINIR